MQVPQPLDMYIIYNNIKILKTKTILIQP